MSDIARVIAVADLLVDEGRDLSRAAIVHAAAEKAARLTRAGRCTVELLGHDWPLRASYPSDGTPSAPESVMTADVATETMSGTVTISDPVDGEFSTLDQWFIDIVARHIESQIAVVDMHEAELAARDAVADAEIAGQLQCALISADRLHTEGAHGAGRLRPARRVGGDLFDLLEIDGDLVVVIADVSGKGAAASLLTAAVLSSFHHHVRTIGARPGQLLAAVEASMEGMLDRTGRLVTLAIAAVNHRDGVVRIASAGHHPVLIATDDGVSSAFPTAPPMGVAVCSTQERTFDFPDGSCLVLASDGIVDQRNHDGEMFGMQRLAACIPRAAARRAGEHVQNILRDVHSFAGKAPQDDDQAVVVVVAGAGGAL